MEQVIALIVCGVSGAGKTTVGRLLAQRLGWEFLDADDVHPPANVQKMRRGEPLTDDDRRPWIDALRDRLEQGAREQRPMVVACSALKKSYRDRLGIDQQRVLSVFLDGPKDLIERRIARRRHEFMPRSLLDSQFEALEPPGAGIRVAIDATPEDIVGRILAALRRTSGGG